MVPPPGLGRGPFPVSIQIVAEMIRLYNTGSLMIRDGHLPIFLDSQCTNNSLKSKKTPNNAIEHLPVRFKRRGRRGRKGRQQMMTTDPLPSLPPPPPPPDITLTHLITTLKTRWLTWGHSQAPN